MPSNPYYNSPHWLDLRRAALRRAKYRCEVPGCRRPATEGRLYVDHIEARPYSIEPTSADRLDNLRVLCGQCDASVRQTRTGERRNAGQLAPKGCDTSGLPLDPNHPWNKTA
jgi:5-methylcytosine-specific restriction protein A